MMHNLGKNIFPSFRCAFVLPTYEIHESAALPQDKSQLAELVKRFVEELEFWGMVIGAGGDVPHDPQVAAGGVFFSWNIYHHLREKLK